MITVLWTLMVICCTGGVIAAVMVQHWDALVWVIVCFLWAGFAFHLFTQQR